MPKQDQISSLHFRIRTLEAELEQCRTAADAQLYPGDASDGLDDLRRSNDALEREIARRRRIENRLRISESHLRALMENAGNFAVYRLCEAAHSPLGFEVIFVSPSLVDIMRVSDPMRLESWLQPIHPDDKRRFFTQPDKRFDVGHFNGILRINHPALNTLRWIQVVSAVAHDEDQKRQYINGILFDVTEQTRQAQQRDQDRELLEHRVAERTRDLSATNVNLKRQIQERRQTEKVLKQRETQLALKTVHLEEANTALKVLLKQRESDKADMEEKVQLNVRELVLPYVEKLKKGRLDARQKAILDILDSNLNDIVSPFSRNLSAVYHRLTPMEI